MSDPAIRYLEEAIHRAEAAREELDIEVRGLRLALARVQQDRVQSESGRPPTEPVTAEPVSPEMKAWLAMSRTDAVERILAEAGGELHRKEVAERLTATGRGGDTVDAVSAALAYMARGDAPRVESLGHGRWRLRPDGGASSAPPVPEHDHDAPPGEGRWPRSWPGPFNGSATDPVEVEEVGSTQG